MQLHMHWLMWSRSSWALWVAWPWSLSLYFTTKLFRPAVLYIPILLEDISSQLQHHQLVWWLWVHKVPYSWLGQSSGLYRSSPKVSTVDWSPCNYPRNNLVRNGHSHTPMSSNMCLTALHCFHSPHKSPSSLRSSSQREPLFVNSLGAPVATRTQRSAHPKKSRTPPSTPPPLFPVPPLLLLKSTLPPSPWVVAAASAACPVCAARHRHQSLLTVPSTHLCHLRHLFLWTPLHQTPAQPGNTILFARATSTRSSAPTALAPRRLWIPAPWSKPPLRLARLFQQRRLLACALRGRCGIARHPRRGRSDGASDMTWTNPLMRIEGITILLIWFAFFVVVFFCVLFYICLKCI